MPADTLMFVLLLLAVAIGFVLGRWRKRGPAAVDPKFYQSLNYLLNDEQDLAVDTLIEQLGIDDGTYDTYLALGTLVRKRGEVDKAINIHQNLLARPDLPQPKRAEAELELASDFLGAGLLGRAENLLLSMLENLGNLRGEWARNSRRQAQALLVGLYERESDWEKAVSIARGLAKTDDDYRSLVAHICCELAEANLAGSGQLTDARAQIKEAHKYAPNSARVALVAGKIELQEGNASAALKKFNEALVLDVDLALDLLPLAGRACSALEDPSKLLAFVRRAINVSEATGAAADAVANPTSVPTAAAITRPAASHPSVQAPVAVLLTEAELVEQLEGNSAAQELLLRYLGSVHSVSQLSGLLATIEADALVQAIPAGLLDTLTHHLQQLVAVHHSYRCRNCGFGASSRHWRCPSCQQWGSHRSVA